MCHKIVNFIILALLSLSIISLMYRPQIWMTSRWDLNKFSCAKWKFEFKVKSKAILEC